MPNITFATVSWPIWISAVSAAMRERPKATAVGAVFLIVTGLSLILAREAAAAYTFNCTSATPCGKGFARDSDGYVREGPGDLNPGPLQPRKWHILGQTSWYSYSTGPPGNTTTYDDSIRYDWPETHYTNTPEWMVRRHERAHSRGWAHNEGPDSRNDAYSPNVRNS